MVWSQRTSVKLISDMTSDCFTFYVHHSFSKIDGVSSSDMTSECFTFYVHHSFSKIDGISSSDMTSECFTFCVHHSVSKINISSSDMTSEYFTFYVHHSVKLIIFHQVTWLLNVLHSVYVNHFNQKRAFAQPP